MWCKSTGETRSGCNVENVTACWSPSYRLYSASNLNHALPLVVLLGVKPSGAWLRLRAADRCSACCDNGLIKGCDHGQTHHANALIMNPRLFECNDGCNTRHQLTTIQQQSKRLFICILEHFSCSLKFIRLSFKVYKAILFIFVAH